MGRLKHSVGTYDRLIRATAPVIKENKHQTHSNFFLLLSFDTGTDAKYIIENEFPNKSVAEITDVARIKIKRMLLQKYGKNLDEFRVYPHHKFPYMVAAKLKDGTYTTLVLR